jgi:hypothetical protein
MDCIIYYGTEVPNLQKTRDIRDTFLVLQKYHPLCQAALLERYFPNCRRFIYWNPCRIANDSPEAGDGQQVRTATRPIDLVHPASRGSVLESALEIMQIPHVHGLFVDDLDCWSDSPGRRELALSLLRDLERLADRSFSFFINRGFPFWRNVANLEAVLLESISIPFLLSCNEQDFRWIRDFVLPCVDALEDHLIPIAVFASSYHAKPARWNDRSRWRALIPCGDSMTGSRLEAADYMAERISKTLFLNPKLDEWPKVCMTSRLRI